jgi:soluble lytic murein transglycosylase-like protein
MWQQRGKNTTRLLAAALLSCGIVVFSGDSPAQAGLLKNSVRVGDRSAMTIVRKPQPGQKRLIRPPSPIARAPAAGEGETQGWFWEEQSTQAAAAGSERWAGALASVLARRAEGGALFSEDRLRGIKGKFETQIAAAARAHGVSEVLLLAVIAVESAGQTRAASPKGAQGLMQLIPATARRFGVANSFDPAQNILGGAAYLDWLLRRFDEDAILALAGYNAGEGAVERYKGVPPYDETRDYVVKVFDALAAAEALCRVPADTPRSTCGWPSAPPT